VIGRRPIVSDELVGALLAGGARSVRVRRSDGSSLDGHADDGGSELPEVAPDWSTTIDGTVVEVWGAGDDAMFGAVARLGASRERMRGELDELTTVMVEAHDRLLTLYELARVQVGSLDGDEAARTILGEALRITGSTAAIVVSPAGTTKVGVPGSGDTCAWLDELATTFDGKRSSLVARETCCAVVVPVTGRTGARAVLAVARPASKPYNTGDQKLIEAVGSTLAGALDLVALHEQAVARILIEREHETASTLAQAALPRSIPTVQGVDLYARSVPARTAGGDFYTFAQVGDTFYFSLGDIAGKGLPAALVMTRVVFACQAAFVKSGTSSLDDVMAAIDDELYPYLSDVGLFATMVIGSYRIGSDTLRVCNAGHSPTIVVHGEQVDEIDASAPPVGVLPGIRCTVEELPVAAGDVLVVGSDGLVEQVNAAGELMGYDDFRETIVRDRTEPAAVIAQHLFDHVAAHAGDEQPSDDRTILVMKFDRVDPPVPSVPQATVQHLALPADFASLRELEPWLDLVLMPLAGQLAEPPKGRIELALHELCTNVVDHAYEHTAGTIVIDSSLVGHRLALTVTDTGRPFEGDAVAVPDPDVPQVRGYGLMILAQLTDEMAYERAGDRNVWHLAFDLSVSDTPRRA
jgi:serine phosphatase RsbU (regulator of sigma subunit)/anti-sigma regulatory factor (Ser/Thr protein kinase)